MPEKWSSLRGLGQNRLLRTSYLWLLTVPLLVKLLNKLHETGGVVFGAYRIPLDFELPFSWELFFYSAVFASLANLIYVWKCPRIVKDYTSYVEFKEQGKGRDQLRREFASLLYQYRNQLNVRELYGKVREYFELYCHEAPPLAVPPFPAMMAGSASAPERAQYMQDLEKAVGESRITPESEPDVFWFIHHIADTLNTGFRVACFLFYAVALCLSGFVLLQNIWFVVQYTYEGAMGRR